MKTIQITVDERLLARIDADEETKRDGRSAVFRRAVTEYLKHRRRKSIAEAHGKAYGSGSALGREFKGWEDEGVWPSE
jgi:metal-responsive CopG/Arc/MetJ family transcriptional regulator